MNDVTLEPPSSREILLGVEKDYAAMYNMICAHSMAQIARCAALFSFGNHLAAGPATAEAVAHVEGLDMDATFRLTRACAAYGLMIYDKDRGFSATPLLPTLRKDASVVGKARDRLTTTDVWRSKSRSQHRFRCVRKSRGDPCHRKHRRTPWRGRNILRAEVCLYGDRLLDHRRTHRP
jgi:hypothetical protein